MDTKKKLSDVYGVSRGVPLTYVERTSVDNRFMEDITRDKHIVIHGGSKQGKTCLRRHNLQDSDYVTIQCTREMSKASLYEMLLKYANARVEISRSERSETSVSTGAGAEASGDVPFFAKVKAKVKIDKKRSEGDDVVTKQLEIDLQDPNDISRVLTELSFERYVLLEDFHYLDEEVQRAFSVDLKVFYEISRIVFIVIGVWLESNRLVYYNGDLAGRMATIDADVWTKEELKKVVEAGESLLNVKFAESTKNAIIDGCQDNVGLVQEACYRLCEKHSVWSTQENIVNIDDASRVQSLYSALANEQAERHRNFLSEFAAGLNAGTKLDMYRWIAWAIVISSTAELKHGLRPNVLFQRISSKHPNQKLQQNNVSQALKRIGNLQYKRKVQPLVLDFSNSLLRVVDASFLLYLENAKQEDILESIGINPDT